MGMLDKLKFWKKKDAFPSLKLDIPQAAGAGSGMGGFGQDATAGLGGTGALGGMKETEISLRGFGAETIEEQPARLTPAPLGGSSYGGGFGQPQQAPRADIMAKDIEIISSKLDTLRATIDSINQRLANIEAYMNDQKRRGGW